MPDERGEQDEEVERIIGSDAIEIERTGDLGTEYRCDLLGRLVHCARIADRARRVDHAPQRPGGTPDPGDSALKVIGAGDVGALVPDPRPASAKLGDACRDPFVPG